MELFAINATPKTQKKILKFLKTIKTFYFKFYRYINILTFSIIVSQKFLIVLFILYFILISF